MWVNDDEPGIQEDALEWLDKLAPPSWQEPSNDVARELLPEGGDYRHHRGGRRAMPRMCGMLGMIGLGLNGKRSQLSIAKPAASIAAWVSRVG